MSEDFKLALLSGDVATVAALLRFRYRLDPNLMALADHIDPEGTTQHLLQFGPRYNTRFNKSLRAEIQRNMICQDFYAELAVAQGSGSPKAKSIAKSRVAEKWGVHENTVDNVRKRKRPKITK